MSAEYPVMLKTYDADNPALVEVNYNEVMRYGGMMTSRSTNALSEDADETAVRALIDVCAAEACPRLTYKLSYRYAPITWDEDSGLPVLPFDTHSSRNLAHVLTDCTEAVLFAATIGVGIDRLIAKYNRVSPSRALIMQALGAERIEALCDLFNGEIAEDAAKRGLICVPRFSPGYGDLPLEVQREFMVLLDCAHLIGVNLNASMLMSPSKSVTAIIGLKKEKL